MTQTAHFSLLPVGVLAFGLLATLQPQQDEAVSLKTNYSEGLALQSDTTVAYESERIAFSMTRDGEEIDMSGRMGGPSTQLRTTSITDVYGSIKDGAPVSVTRTFDTLEGTSVRSMGDEEMENTANGPLEGISLELTLEDDEVTAEVVDGTEPEDETLLEGHSLALGLDALLPDGEVELGDGWDFDGAVLMSVLGFDVDAQLFPPVVVERPEGGERGGWGGRMSRPQPSLAQLFLDAEWEGEAELSDELIEIEGVACHVIEFNAEGEVDIPDPPAREGGGRRGGDAEGYSFSPLAPGALLGGTGILAIEGKLYFSVDLGRPVALEAESTTTVDTETTREGRMGEMVTSSTTESTMTIELTISEAEMEEDE
jgi:hypothetical protein